MKHRILRLILTAAITSVLVLAGCGEQQAAAISPFTELSWNASVDDMIKAEGNGYETYDSIYQGTTYTYSKTYLEKEGMIKYMYDSDGKLCNVSWAYTGESPDSVMTVYRNVCKDTEKIHGKSTSDDGVGNYGQVWNTAAGTVMASAVITNDVRVMQIAYMSEEVSKQQAK